MGEIRLRAEHQTVSMGPRPIRYSQVLHRALQRPAWYNTHTKHPQTPAGESAPPVQYCASDGRPGRGGAERGDLRWPGGPEGPGPKGPRGGVTRRVSQRASPFRDETMRGWGGFWDLVPQRRWPPSLRTMPSPAPSVAVGRKATRAAPWGWGPTPAPRGPPGTPRGAPRGGSPGGTPLRARTRAGQKTGIGV